MVLLGEVGPHRDHGAACFGQRDHRREPKDAKQEKKNILNYGLWHVYFEYITRAVARM